MAKQSLPIAKRMREVLLDGKWIANTNFKDQLEQVHFKEATYRIQELNTIALLTFHIDYYVAGLLRVLQEGILDMKDALSFDMLPVQDEADWQQRKQQFFDHAEALVRAIEQLTDEDLDAPFVDPRYGSVRRNLEAMLEHAYYHLGQVTLMRKWISSLSEQ